jgi:hypothetical protein
VIHRIRPELFIQAPGNTLYSVHTGDLSSVLRENEFEVLERDESESSVEDLGRRQNSSPRRIDPRQPSRVKPRKGKVRHRRRSSRPGGFPPDDSSSSSSSGNNGEGDWYDKTMSSSDEYLEGDKEGDKKREKVFIALKAPWHLVSRHWVILFTLLGLTSSIIGTTWTIIQLNTWRTKGNKPVKEDTKNVNVTIQGVGKPLTVTFRGSPDGVPWLAGLTKTVTTTVTTTAWMTATSRQPCLPLECFAGGLLPRGYYVPLETDHGAGHDLDSWLRTPSTAVVSPSSTALATSLTTPSSSLMRPSITLLSTLATRPFLLIGLPASETTSVL